MLFKAKLLTLLSLLLLLTGISAVAQNNITVKSFAEDPNETTPRVHPVTDPSSGDKCALIIVTNVEAGGYHFDFGGLYSKVEERTVGGRPAYLVYVAPGARRVTISNSNSSIGTLRDYRFSKGLAKATTYRMELGEIYLSTQKQYLEFTVSPTDAYLEVNGEPWALNSDGYVSKSVPFGTYNYMVKATDYHAEPGTVVVNDPNQAVKVNLRLRPAYGFLTVNGGDALEGANIYIDEKRVGTGNIIKTRLASGTHTLKISKDLYNPYQETVVIKDNEETIIRPMLDGNFAQAHVRADGSDIYLDGRKLGTGEWFGQLVPGDYVFEARRSSHRPARKQVSVLRKGQKIEVVMPIPEPIYGSINVESTPRGAQVKVDGVLKGNTPISINNILVGQHTVEVSLKGYQPSTQTVNVEDGLETTVKPTLTNLITLLISAPNSEAVYVDGTRQELTSGSARVSVRPGRHTISATPNYSYYYKPFSTTENYTQNQSVYIKHKSILRQRKDMYILAGGTVGSMTTFGGALGFHAGGFCFEAEYQYAGLNDDVNMYMYSKDPETGDWGEGLPHNSSYTDQYVDLWPEHILTARAGWRILTGSGFHITPMLGYRILTDFDEYANSITFSARVDYMWNHNFGVVLTPEYYQNIGACYDYNKAAHFSSKAKSYMTGFNVNLSFMIMF